MIDRVAETLIGRERIVAQAVTRLHTGAHVVLEGEAGIGKSAILRAAASRVEAAWTWSTQCVPSESRTGLVVLSDLFGSLPATALPAMPMPLRRVVDIVVFRSAPDDADDPIDARALGTAAQAALEALASRGSVLLVIDDVHWCDDTSRKALSFALRRIGADRVRMLATCRADQRVDLPDAHWLPVGPLSTAVLRRLIRSSAPGRLRPGMVERIVAAAEGNPLFAIELARAAGPGDEHVVLPREVRSAISRHLDELTVPQRTTLLDITVRGGRNLADVDAGIIESLVHTKAISLHEGRAWLRHPLVGMVVVDSATSSQLQDAHARAARQVTDPSTRALHRAEAGSDDPELGIELESSARKSLSRGDMDGARHLARLALARDRSPSRLLLLAELESELGDPRAATALASELLSEPTDVLYRNKALRIMAWAQDDVAHADELLTTAIGLEGLPREVELATRAQRGLLLRIGHRTAEAAAELETVVALSRIGTAEWATAVAHLAVSRRLLGHPTEDELLARAVAVDRDVGCDKPGLAMVASATILAWDDRHDDAFALFAEADAIACSHGSFSTGVLQEAALKLRIGRLSDAASDLEQYLDRTTGADRVPALLALATVLTWQGQPDQARARTAESDELERGRPPREALRRDYVLGLLALLDHEPAEAWILFERGLHEYRQQQIGEHSMVPLIPAAAEVTARCGFAREANQLIALLDEQATRLGSRWAASSADVTRGHLDASQGNWESAGRGFLRGADAFDCLGLPLDAARARLSWGVAQRRRGHRSEAAAVLSAAAESFAACGAEGLHAEALDEARRCGRPRATSSSGLTPTEQKVADLVGTGMRNADVAASLHVSVKTVETHLSAIYRKLGLTNRTALARHLEHRTPSHTRSTV